MDRRRFLKSVGKMLGAAAAAPLVPLAIPKQAAREEIVRSVLPSEITVPPAMFRWLQYLQEEVEQQLAIKDLPSLNKFRERARLY